MISRTTREMVSILGYVALAWVAAFVTAKGW